MVMMGSQLFGAVDQVPGVFHVATKFMHLNFLPIVPHGSVLVFDKKLTGGELCGVEIPVSVKSILVAWLRAGIIFFSIGCGLTLAVFLFEALDANVEPRRAKELARVFWVLAVAIPVLLFAWWLSYRATRASFERAQYWMQKAGIENEFEPLVVAYFESKQASVADAFVASTKAEDDVLRLE